QTFDVLLAPRTHQLRDGRQRPPVGRQRVFHPRRHHRVDLAADDAVALQLPKLLRQHAFADVGDEAPQLPEPVDPGLEPEQDQGLPLAPDHVERGLHRAVVDGGLLRFPCSHTYPDVRIPFFRAYLIADAVQCTIPARGDKYDETMRLRSERQYWWSRP